MQNSSRCLVELVLDPDVIPRGTAAGVKDSALIKAATHRNFTINGKTKIVAVRSEEAMKRMYSRK